MSDRRKLSFSLKERGYDVVDHQSPQNAVPRPDMERAGWVYRRQWGERKKVLLQIQAAEEAARTQQQAPVKTPPNPFAGEPSHTATNK